MAYLLESRWLMRARLCRNGTMESSDAPYPLNRQRIRGSSIIGLIGQARFMSPLMICTRASSGGPKLHSNPEN